MLRVHGSLWLNVAMWGMVFVAVHEALGDFNALQLVTVRFAIVCVLFGVLLLLRTGERGHFSRREWGLIVLAGFLAVPASQLAIIYAQNFLSPALASLLITTSPAVAAVLSPILLRERISALQAAGFVVALVGAVLVILRGAGTGVDVGSASIVGAAIGLITPVAWALYTIISRVLATAGHPPLGTVGVTLLIGSIFLIPLIPFTAGAVDDASAQALGWVLYLAFFGTFVAYLVWFWALRHLEAGRTAAYLYLVPLFALLWGFLILRDVPPLGALAGGVLIIAGVALTQLPARQPSTVSVGIEP